MMAEVEPNRVEEHKHIVFIVRGLHDMGGIERVTIVVAGMLAKVGYRVTILCIQGGEPYFSIPKEIQVAYLPESAGHSRRAKLQGWIALHQPSLIVVSGTNRPLFILKAAGECPIIAWEHLNATISAHPLHNIYRRAYARRATIVTLSEADKASWLHRIPDAEVHCIPNPATLPEATPSTLEAKRVLALGRLAGQKGFDLLIEAWSLIAAEYPDWVLCIVGSGRKEQALRKQIARLGLEERIEMKPATKDVISVYQQASIYALSSRYEGFGLVLVEAMQMGLPVVSFDCPHGPREIVSDGETGILVPDGDTELFAEALRHLMDSPELRLRMSQEALRQVDRYSTATLTSKWVALIESLI